MTLNLDALEATARAATPGPWTINWETDEYHAGMPDKWALSINGPEASEFADLDSADAEHIATFDPPTVLALITRLREAERERDGARWAAGIVGDVARESSGGWQDASAELHAAQDRLREAEAVIEEVDDLVTRHHLDTTVGQAVFKITGSYYKPTNQEGGNDGT